MAKFRSDKIISRANDLIDTGDLLLWVLNAERKPPHIGISRNAKYFSLKVNGKDDAVPCSIIMDVITAKKIPALVYHVVTEPAPAPEDFFSLYEKVIPGTVTCLDPVKRMLGYEADTLHDLLNQLGNDGRLGLCVGLNITANFEGIPSYTLADIHEHLSDLEHVQG